MIDLDAMTAVFDSREAAQAAADAVMPRRKHKRPYAQGSGWHWARSIRCPVCDAAINAECTRPPDWRYQTLHREREDAARAMGRAADRWIVCAYANLILLRDGTMYDHARRVTVRP